MHRLFYALKINPRKIKNKLESPLTERMLFAKQMEMFVHLESHHVIDGYVRSPLWG